MREFDKPLFKRLAHNDTGKAVGHQGGILIPKAMDDYFPPLKHKASVLNPTADVRIIADLFAGPVFLEQVDTRYQYQTWGGTRSAERRLTDHLTKLRNLASAGDILVIERGLDDPLRFRLTLHRKGTPGFTRLDALVGNRQWGPVNVQDKPVTETMVSDSLVSQEAREQAPLVLFDEEAPLVETRTRRVARSRAFQQRILPLYQNRCAVCGHAHEKPEGQVETEAAHIVPRSVRGADDARNGLALCRSHHWAFDAGLFGIAANRRIVVPAPVAAVAGNAHLLPYQGTELAAPVHAHLRPAAEALAWHLANIVRQP